MVAAAALSGASALASPSSSVRAVDSDGRTCFGQAPTIVGTDADDGQLKGTDGADVIIAAKGADVVDAGAGNDLICLRGEGDRTDAGEGSDKVRGGGGADTVIGGPGKDELRGGRDDDELAGGPGRDNLNGRAGDDGCDGGPGKDHLKSCERGTTAGANRPPVATADSASADEDHAASIAVLANDSDPEGGTVAIGTLDTTATHGTAAANADGTVTYDPHGQFDSLAAGETGHDSFGYSATDGSADSEPATVDVTVSGVDDAPTALADAKSLTEDDPATAIGVLANDADVDGGPKTIAAKTNGSHGAVAITGSGSGLTYKPDANFCGIDSFTYTLNGGSSTTVSVTVACAEDAAAAVNDSTTLVEDAGATTIDVRANDTDPDATKDLITAKTNGANGTVAITSSGADLTYTPAADFCSSDSFTYTLAGGSTATVAVTVDCTNDPPVNTAPATAATNEDTDHIFSGANTISVADVDDASLKVTLTATHGTLTLSGTAGLAFTAGDGTADQTMTFNGSKTQVNAALNGLSFAPTANYSGAASLQIATTDAASTTDTDSVAITVTAVEDPGTAAPDSATLDEDAGATTIDVRANDTDPDATKDLITAKTDGANGSVAITNAGADLVYTPTADICGPDSFTYTLAGGSSATVNVTVNCVNDPPVNTVPTPPVAASEDVAVVLSPLSVADSDAAPGLLEVSLTVTHGTLSLSGTAGLFFTAGSGTGDAAMTFTGTQADINAALNGTSFKPADDFNGGAQFQITTSDQGNTGSGGTKTDSDTVTIFVSSSNDAPVVDLNGQSDAGNDSTATFSEVAAHDFFGAVAIAPNATIDDVDDANIESMTVTLSAPHADGDDFERLSVTLALPPPMTGTYNPATGTLSLTGSAPTADYQSVLRSIKYNNTASPPSAADRSISVTVNDGDGDSTSRTATVHVVPLSPPSATSAIALVAESGMSTSTGALVTGSLPSQNTEVATDNLTYSFGDEGAASTLPFTWGSSVTASDAEGGDPALGALKSAGNNVTWSVSADGLTLTGTANAQTVIKAELTNSNIGAYTVTLLGQLDHPDTNESGSNDQIALAIPYTVKDATGQAAASTLTVSVNDDAPTTQSQTKTISPGDIDTNLMLIVDISGSQADASGLANLTRFDVLKPTLEELIKRYDAAGNVAVRIVTYSTNASSHGSTWESASSARAYIDSLSPNGTTNYDAALTTAESAFASAGKIAGGSNVSYFFSDGQPNAPSGSPGVSPSEEAAWQSFLTANNILSLAVGVSSDVNASALNPIAYDGRNDVNANATVYSDLSQLPPPNNLAAGVDPALNGAITGNLLTAGGDPGADQPDSVGSIGRVGDRTFTYDATADSVTQSGSGTTTFTFNATTNVITLTTAAGPTLAVDFDNGAFTYDPHSSGTTSQAFNFARRDADADTSTSTASFNVTGGDFGPITRSDRVITNDPGSGVAFTIQDAWLLYNDVDSDGDALSITGVSNAQDGAASHASTDSTFTDNDTDGGSFEYTAQSTTLTDAAKATIDRSQLGENSLDGTDLADVLLARSTATTLNGLAGADVLAGGAGSDTLNGGGGDDLLDGRENSDVLTGGQGDDTVDVSDGNEVAFYTSALDGTDTLTGFDGVGGTGAQDQVLLDALFDSLGVPAASRAARIQIVSGGSSSDVYVNADNSNPDFELHIATIFTTDSISVGADIDVGS